MLRIGFLTYHNPYDRNSFSGTTYYMFSALREHSQIELSLLGESYFGEPSFLVRLARKLKGFWGCLFSDVTHDLELKALVKHVKKDIAMQKIDVIVCPVSHVLVQFLIGHKDLAPIILITDATPSYIQQYYGVHKTQQEIDSEELAVRHASKVIYSSHFMADLARQEYALSIKSPDKIEAVSFGLNLDDVPDLIEPKDLFNEVNLLFVGRDWERKGGQKALLAHELLIKSGIPSKLCIVGCNPLEALNKVGVTIIPNVNKNIPEQQKYYYDLLEKAHFLLLPTSADCTPMVIAEANAFGTPVITTDISGIPTLVQSGKNGFLLEVDADEAEYAAIVKKEFSNKRGYQKLSSESRAAYETRLNWEVWASEIYQISKGIN